MAHFARGIVSCLGQNLRSKHFNKLIVSACLANSFLVKCFVSIYLENAQNVYKQLVGGWMLAWELSPNFDSHTSSYIN